jgi:cell division protein FtsW
MSGAIGSIRNGFGLGLRGRSTSRKKKARKSQPVEYQLIITATMCLVAFGAVMVFSASSTSSLLGEQGDGAFYLKRTLMFGAIGLVALHFLARARLSAIRRMTPMLLAVTFGLLVVVLAMPAVNGAKSWIVFGPAQVQPAEIMKVVLLLYGAHLIAARPQMTDDLRSMMPYLLVVGGAFGLIMLQPDFGTTMVTALGVAALLIAGGAKLRHLAMIAGAIAFVGLIAVMMEPYRMERLTTFLNPGADPSGAGFQTGQASIALGSGGLFGVGLGESVQKAFYLPEAHTDMISAVIGEEIGLAGITVLVGLYMLIGYGGFRTAQKAKDRYGRLLAAALTAIILIQATINLYAAMGMAPLTGVTLPFVSYGNSSLIVTLAAVGLLLNIANGGTAAMAGDGRRTASTRRASTRRPRSRPALGGLRVIDGERETRPRRSAQAKPRGRASSSRPARRTTSSGGSRAARSDSRRRDSGARSAGARRRRRAR